MKVISKLALLPLLLIFLSQWAYAASLSHCPESSYLCCPQTHNKTAAFMGAALTIYSNNSNGSCSYEDGFSISLSNLITAGGSWKPKGGIPGGAVVCTSTKASDCPMMPIGI